MMRDAGKAAFYASQHQDLKGPSRVCELNPLAPYDVRVRPHSQFDR